MAGVPGSENRTVLARLMAVIEDRNRHRPFGSYTALLLEGGIEAIGAKVIEEAAELVVAAKRGGQPPEGEHSVLHEAADLVYHLFVLMAHCGLSLESLEGELSRRFGVSGLAEKARRPSEQG